VCRFPDSVLALQDLAVSTDCEWLDALFEKFQAVACQKCFPTLVHNAGIAWYHLGNCDRALEIYRTAKVQDLSDFGKLNRSALRLAFLEGEQSATFVDVEVRAAAKRNETIAQAFIHVDSPLARSQRLTMAVLIPAKEERLSPTPFNASSWTMHVSNRRGLLWHHPNFQSVPHERPRRFAGMCMQEVRWCSVDGMSFATGLTPFVNVANTRDRSVEAILEATRSNGFALPTDASSDAVFVDSGRLYSAEKLVRLGDDAERPTSSEGSLADDFLQAVTQRRTAKRMSIHRDFLVVETAMHSNTLHGDEVLAPWEISYAGETAIDGGMFRGVTADLFSIFVEQIVEDWQRHSRKFGDVADDAFGCIIAKCVIDNRPLDLSLLPREQWNVILRGQGLSVTHPPTAAMAQYDPQLVTVLHTSLSDAEIIASLEHDNGDPVTPVSSPLYQTETLSKACARIEARLLRAANGYARFMSFLPASLRRLLTPETVLRRLEPLPVTAQDIVSRLEFCGWQDEDATPYFLCCWVHGASTQKLKGFVRLCTGGTVLMRAGNLSRISIVRADDRFASKTCFWQLQIPSFTDLSSLADSLDVAVGVADSRMDEM
jgi:hypothetical protein